MSATRPSTAAPAPAADGPPVLAIEGARATIRLCRPSEHNRIDPEDIPRFVEHLETVEREPGIDLLVVTGTGTTTFSSGYTIEAIRTRLDRGFERMLDRLESMPMPTLCALNGSVYGGATDLAICCDFRIGVAGSRMFMPAARFGLHYYPGGLRRFVARIGADAAKRIFLTAMTLEAPDMLRLGFLTDLVAPDQLRAAVDAYAAALAECDAGVVRSMKQHIDGLAAGTWSEKQGRDAYVASLRSEELARRLARRRK